MHMRIFFAAWLSAAAILSVCIVFEMPPGDSKTPSPFVSLRMVEIDKSLSVGYAVLLVDVNGDGKKDIVVVDTTRVVWYENPTWKRHTIIPGQTKPDKWS